MERLSSSRWSSAKHNLKCLCRSEILCNLAGPHLVGSWRKGKAGKRGAEAETPLFTQVQPSPRVVVVV
jgi:hypothetical protein